MHLGSPETPELSELPFWSLWVGWVGWQPGRERGQVVNNTLTQPVPVPTAAVSTGCALRPAPGPPQIPALCSNDAGVPGPALPSAPPLPAVLFGKPLVRLGLGLNPSCRILGRQQLPVGPEAAGAQTPGPSPGRSLENKNRGFERTKQVGSPALLLLAVCP